MQVKWFSCKGLRVFRGVLLGLLFIMNKRIKTMSLYQRIYDVVKCIPAGMVTSYGRIARMLNCTARQVGYAMAATPDDQAVPWHRVINSKGQISARKQGNGEQRQRQKLMDEGIVFNQQGRISFQQFGWTTIDNEQWKIDG